MGHGKNQDKNCVNEISRRTNLSKSTVSKALNNCRAVNAQSKEAVVKAACELHYTPPRAGRILRRKNGAIIGVAIPVNPCYFWNDAIRGMKAAEERHEGVQLVFSLFANTLTERDALYCLEYLLNLQIELLIVTPPPFPGVWEKLREIAHAIPVVCFNETGEFPFLFYAGADFYRDGIRLARACAPALRDHPGLLSIVSSPMPMVRCRDEAFYHEAQALVPDLQRLGEVSICSLDTASMSAQLARALHDKYDGRFRSVYVSQGFLPRVCLALRKLSLLDSVVAFGYENPRQTAAYIQRGTIAALVAQDTYEQGLRCVEAVFAYLDGGALPDGRQVLVPSRICDLTAEG